MSILRSDSYSIPLWVHLVIYSLGNIQHYRTHWWSNMIQMRYLHVYLMNNNRLSLQQNILVKQRKLKKHIYLRFNRRKYKNLLANWIVININQQSAFIFTRKIWFLTRTAWVLNEVTIHIYYLKGWRIIFWQTFKNV